MFQIVDVGTYVRLARDVEVVVAVLRVLGQEGLDGVVVISS